MKYVICSLVAIVIVAFLINIFTVGDVEVIAKIIDEEGNAITNANFHIQYYHGNEFKHETATSNQDGVARLTFTSSKSTDYSYMADAAGYYRSERFNQHIRFKEWFFPVYQIKHIDKQINNEIVLRKIINPVPMEIASFPAGKKFPKIGDDIFFDLEKMDWLPPHGRGKIGDIRLKCKLDEKENRYVGTVLEFVGRGCGAVIIPVNNNSLLKSPYKADPVADYKNTYYFDMKTAQDYSEGCLIARVRTVFNDKDEIVSSHYVKIYNLALWGAIKSTGIYFNPIPNDTSLECDVHTSNNMTGYEIYP